MSARRSWRRRALFAVTDPRTMGTTAVGLMGILTVSVATEARTAVVYPWNAPRARIAEDPAPSIAPPVEATSTATEAVSIAPEEALAEVTPEPEAPEAPGTESPLGEESGRPADVPPATVATSTGTPDRAVTTPSAAAAAAAGAAAAGDRPTVTATRRADAAVPEPSPPPPIDLGPAIVALEAAEAAIEQGRPQAAADALERVRLETAGVETAALGPGGGLRARIDAAEDDVALLDFEARVLAAIQVARGAQESGDYPAAIGALEELVSRAEVASGDRARRMIERLDFWQVAATARNLIEACEFERTNLGRTAPCRNR